MELSILIAAAVGSIAAMVVGGVWYSPLLFGAAWKRLAQVPDTSQTNPAMIYGGAFALIFLGALVFGAFIGSSPEVGFAIGAGLSAGLAWAAGSLWISYIFEGRPVRLGLINGGFHIIQYGLIGLAFAIFG
jgi:hypothetical protein